jgi:DNA-binding beta-propeller fold protein YncE
MKMRQTEITEHSRAARRCARLLFALAAIFSIVCLFASVAPAAESELEFEVAKSFGPDGTSATAFGTATVLPRQRSTAVAVDRSYHFVYVLDRSADALYKFDTNGNPVDFGGSSANVSGNKLSELPLGDVNNSHGEGTWLAVNQATHAIYVTAESSSSSGGTEILAFTPSGDPSLFTAGSGANTNVLSTAPELIHGIATDSTGLIWLSLGEGLPNRVAAFEASGADLLAEVKYTGTGNVPIAADQIAVDEAGNLYLGGTGIAKYEPTEYPVTSRTRFQTVASATPAGKQITSVDFNSATHELYVATASEAGVSVFKSAHEQELELLTTFGRSGEEGELGGGPEVAVDPASERIFVTNDREPEGGLSQVEIFQPKRCYCAPAVVSTRVTEVTGDSAKVHGRINPDTFETKYWVEYGAEDCELNPCVRVPLAGAQVGAGFRPVAVSQALDGLHAETLYHYRIAAENALGTTHGTEKTFTTQGSGLGFQLLDSRAWEMVSPPDKHGGSLVLGTSGIIEAAEEGNGLAYLSLGSIEVEPEGNRAIESSSVLARRESGGWHSRDITPPHAELTPAHDAEYKQMTPDLASSLLEARDNTPLSPLTTERTPYIRRNAEPPLYTPLLTSAEGHADVPAGIKWDEQATSFGNVDPLGANADLGTVAFRSTVALTEGAESEALYSWSNGQIQPVSQLPSANGGRVVEGFLGSWTGSVRNAISEDGSRIFWGPGSPPAYLTSGINTTALYLHDTSLKESVRLDVLQSGASGSGAPRPAFQGASADGTVVYFTDSHHLTKNASPEGRDLYRCEIPSGASLGGCATLTDISAPRKGSGESAMAQDLAPAFSEDGSRVYFVAEGVLDTNPNRQGDTASTKEPNLYLWEKGVGVRFIATLSQQDSLDWGAVPTRSNGFAGEIVADASPSGRYFAFMSQNSLTGYDNSEAAGGEPVEEAYRYDAVTGELTCVSCNPTGGSPRAQLLRSSESKVDPADRWTNRWLAAVLPGPRVSQRDSTSLYRPRVALDDGRVFFNAYDALVPADSNGGWDVYQYEPTGVGDCSASSGGAAVARSGEGCVGLLSSGTGEEEAVFLDASASGEDVFFLSSAKLSVLDEDNVYDVYDARVNGVAAELPTLAECLGEACQPAVSPPNDATPASAAFRGPGNLSASTTTRCLKAKRKVRRKGKVSCLSRKRVHKGNRKHRATHRKHRANNKRRTGR